MSLVDAKTGQRLNEGQIVELGRQEYRICGLVPKSNTVYLVDLEGDRPPFPISPARLGAKFANVAA